MAEFGGGSDRSVPAAASLTKGMGASMQGACAGLRVLDLTQGMAGPLATMILADFGADVVRIEPPEGDPFWSDASYLLLQRGKQSVSLDSRTDAGRAELANLAPGMDVVVESIGAEATRRAGVGYEELSAANPGLVYCSISGFGPSGPFVQVKADDGLVMAKAGILRDQPGWFGDGQRPVYRAPRDGSYFAAMLAVQGILAAVMARDLTGRGQLVETNLLQALCCRQNPKVRWLLRDGESLPIETSAHETAKEDEHSLAHHRDPREINLIGMRVQTQGRPVDGPFAHRATLLPGLDQRARIRLDLGRRAVQGRTAPVPRRGCQVRARPAHFGSDEGEDLRRMDGGVPPERKRLR